MNMLMNGLNPVGMVYNQSAENIAYDSDNSVEDMLKKVSGTITAKEGVSLSIARRQAIKVGNLKFVTIAFAPLSNMSQNTDILTLSSGFESATLTDLISIDSRGGSKPFAISGNTITTNGALTSGVYYFINSVYF